jgi:hypothetical protein
VFRRLDAVAPSPARLLPEPLALGHSPSSLLPAPATTQDRSAWEVSSSPGSASYRQSRHRWPWTLTSAHRRRRKLRRLRGGAHRHGTTRARIEPPNCPTPPLPSSPRGSFAPHAVEVEEVDERRRAHQPRVAAPGGRVVPPLGASHPRLLLGRNGLSSQQSPVGQLDAESVPAACTFRSCSSACEGCRRRWRTCSGRMYLGISRSAHACRSLAVRTTPARGTTKTTTSSSSPSVARIGNAALSSTSGELLTRSSI